ncbi:hypothetical protein PIB30_073595, partial [Stylosanthes scabra]|nr:hypothetical protein [Stylosanthes scabra]
IKKVADALATVGSPISDTKYTNIILDGLNAVITTVNTREPPLSIPDLEALLMAEEIQETLSIEAVEAVGAKEGETAGTTTTTCPNAKFVANWDTLQAIAISILINK